MIPENSSVRYALAYAYETSQQLQKAIDEYNTLLEFDPDHPNAAFRLERVIQRKIKNEAAHAKRLEAEAAGKARVAAREAEEEAAAAAEAAGEETPERSPAEDETTPEEPEATSAAELSEEPAPEPDNSW